MGPTSRFLSRLRGAFLARDGAGLTDAQLLGRFVERRDEAAFEALLRRHGPMVFGVCRRVLGNNDDARDAFQATFLVFVRKAASLASRGAVGGWLHGVAYRTALEARSRRARRRARERQVEVMPQPMAEPDNDWQELLVLLDRELNRLPEKYRMPVVLCELEGKSRKDAARELKLPEGTLSSRLAMARKLLAKRLSRYGPGVSGAVLAAALAQAASASVPPSLLTSTVQTGVLAAAGQTLAAGTSSAKVVALTEGVMKAMLLSKLKVVWTVVAAVAVSAAAVGLTYRAAAQSSAPTSGEANRAQPAGAGRVAADDLEALRLEMEALRKEVRALRERVKSLEAAQVREEKQQEFREVASLLAAYPAAEDIAVLNALGKESSDPAAEAEVALKKLLKNPNDKEAAQALEQALKRLKEKSKPPGPAGR